MFTCNLIARLSTMVGTVIFASAAQAHDFTLGDIQINHPFARATMPQQLSGGAYIGLENKGKVDDKLIKVESDIAQSVELHRMEETKDNVMKMEEVDQIDLKAGSKISMKPGGGYHLMLVGIKKPLKAGDKFPLTLRFAKAGEIKVTVNVEGNDSEKKSGNHQH